MRFWSKPKDDLRVVMMTALPTDTFRRVFHMSRFILGSMPVENSSMRTTAGLPVKVGEQVHEHNSRLLTHESNGKRKLALVSTG